VPSEADLVSLVVVYFLTLPLDYRDIEKRPVDGGGERKNEEKEKGREGGRNREERTVKTRTTIGLYCHSPGYILQRNEVNT
jgi:hypothetical protein